MSDFWDIRFIASTLHRAPVEEVVIVVGEDCRIERRVNHHGTAQPPPTRVDVLELAPQANVQRYGPEAALARELVSRAEEDVVQRTAEKDRARGLLMDAQTAAEQAENRLAQLRRMAGGGERSDG